MAVVALFVKNHKGLIVSIDILQNFKREKYQFQLEHLLRWWRMWRRAYFEMNLSLFVVPQQAKIRIGNRVLIRESKCKPNQFMLLDQSQFEQNTFGAVINVPKQSILIRWIKTGLVSRSIWFGLIPTCCWCSMMMLLLVNRVSGNTIEKDDKQIDESSGYDAHDEIQPEHKPKITSGFKKLSSIPFVYRQHWEKIFELCLPVSMVFNQNSFLIK